MIRLWDSKGLENLLRINYVSPTSLHTQRFAVTVSFRRKLLTLRQLSHGRNICFYFTDASVRTSSDTASTCVVFFICTLFFFIGYGIKTQFIIIYFSILSFRFVRFCIFSRRISRFKNYS